MVCETNSLLQRILVRRMRQGRFRIQFHRGSSFSPALNCRRAVSRQEINIYYVNLPPLSIGNLDFFLILWLNMPIAGMEKLANSRALGARSARIEGSSPSPGTTLEKSRIQMSPRSARRPNHMDFSGQKR